MVFNAVAAASMFTKRTLYKLLATYLLPIAQLPLDLFFLASQHLKQRLFPILDGNSDQQRLWLSMCCCVCDIL